MNFDMKFWNLIQNLCLIQEKDIQKIAIQEMKFEL